MAKTYCTFPNLEYKEAEYRLLLYDWNSAYENGVRLMPAKVLRHIGIEPLFMEVNGISDCTLVLTDSELPELPPYLFDVTDKAKRQNVLSDFVERYNKSNHWRNIYRATDEEMAHWENSMRDFLKNKNSRNDNSKV